MTSLPMWIAISPADGVNLLVLASLTDHRTAGEQATLDRLAAGVSRLAESEATPAHLVPTITDWGVKDMPVIQRDLLGSVQVGESRSTPSAIWLEVQRSKDEATVILPLEDAKQLRDQLGYLIRSAGA